MSTHLSLVERSKRNYDSVACPHVTSQSVRRFETVHYWHRNVHDEYVWTPRRAGCDRFKTVQRDPTFHRFDREVSCDRIRANRKIVDD
jgi:hypothetical protein